MLRRARFELVYAPETLEHMDLIERRHHRLIRNTIDEKLGYAPNRTTRNRKRLESPAPFGATWELRFGPGNCFRVLYEVDEEQRVVNILAIGIKDRGPTLIAGEEFK